MTWPPDPGSSCFRGGVLSRTTAGRRTVVLVGHRTNARGGRRTRERAGRRGHGSDARCAPGGRTMAGRGTVGRSSGGPVGQFGRKPVEPDARCGRRRDGPDAQCDRRRDGPKPGDRTRGEQDARCGHTPDGRDAQFGHTPDGPDAPCDHRKPDELASPASTSGDLCDLDDRRLGGPSSGGRRTTDARVCGRRMRGEPRGPRREEHPCSPASSRSGSSLGGGRRAQGVQHPRYGRRCVRHDHPGSSAFWALRRRRRDGARGDHRAVRRWTTSSRTT